MPDDLGHIAETVRKSATRAVSKARNQLDKAASMVADEVASFEESLRQCAAEKPFTTILTSVGIGFLLGWWFHRK